MPINNEEKMTQNLFQHDFFNFSLQKKDRKEIIVYYPNIPELLFRPDNNIE